MPSTKNPILTLSVTAAALLLENRAVGQDGNYAAAGQKMFGIGTEDVNAIGDELPVDTLGTSTATAGGAVLKDAALEVGADGKLVTAAAGVVVAKAMQAAGADGDEFEVFLLPK